ncbi:SHOCT domain-containing protein [Helcococcus bovis]|uniref:SHOCT domain-containing protein n=1 Tax=Helcococcus bovis TaxID=3153252 RepID=UPI0038BC1449
MDSKKTYENIEKELDFYISSEILVEMFLLELISLEEYEEITCYNIEEFTPFLGEIMR